MTAGAADSTNPQMLNVPNAITVARLILAVGVFVLIPLQFYMAALVVFLIAAGTDWMDGYWARKYGQVTQLGRILDPFADKIIICGTFIFLSAAAGSGIAAWMTVVIVGRELLVTALRSFLEQQGADFSANMAGKLKMVFQCAAVVAALLALALAPAPTAGEPQVTHWYGPARTMQPAWLYWPLFVSVWLAVVSTVQSGAGYIFKAAQMLTAPDFE